jgi:hypothetical protein
VPLASAPNGVNGAKETARMRIAICGIHIESSTFAPQRAGAADFEVLRGRALLGR